MKRQSKLVDAVKIQNLKLTIVGIFYKNEADDSGDQRRASLSDMQQEHLRE